MLLRESSEHSGDSVQFENIVGEGLTNSPVPFATELVRFADAVLGDDETLKDQQRQELRSLLGREAFVDVVAVVAMFNAVVIVADASGIPLEPVKKENSRDIREALNLDAFREHSDT